MPRLFLWSGETDPMASHETIAHRWAQNAKPGANLTGYAMFCAGGRIYSHGHRFVIARFVSTKARKGVEARDVVLFNADGYSVSTAKHKSIVSRAIPRRFEVFQIPDLHADADYTLSDNGKAVIDWNVKAAVAFMQKAAKARTRGPWLVEQAEEHLDDAAKFAEAFGHKWKRPASLDAMVAKATKDAAKQAKANADARKAEAARRAEELTRQRHIDSERFLQWRRGENVRVPQSYRVDDNGRCYVRRSPDGADLETSQGAFVPWPHAVKAFRFIRLCVERGEGFKANGRVVRVGHYSVDSIDADGNMVAGCHRFDWADMRALAEREGVFDLAPSADAVETREG